LLQLSSYETRPDLLSRSFFEKEGLRVTTDTALSWLRRILLWAMAVPVASGSVLHMVGVLCALVDLSAKVKGREQERPSIR